MQPVSQQNRTIALVLMPKNCLKDIPVASRPPSCRQCELNAGRCPSFEVRFGSNNEFKPHKINDEHRSLKCDIRLIS